MNLIYAYKFIPTNEIKYVGKTNNLNYRRQQHEEYDIQNPNQREYHYPLSRAIRKYGKDKFDVLILEDNILDSDVEEREKYWINFYNTYNNGYNQTEGGLGGHHYEKFTKEEIELIIQMIKEQVPFKEIATRFNISISHLSGINTGTKHHKDNESYPLNKMTRGRKLTDDDITSIIDLLLNSNLEQYEIAKQFNVAQTTISKINLGKTHVQPNLSYPLRDAYKTRRKEELEYESKFSK